MQDLLNRMRVLAARHADGALSRTIIPRVAISFAQEPPARAMPGVFEPMHCLVLQGAKEVTIGERRMRYDPSTYFVAALEVPATGRITEASPSLPYIGVSLALDSDALAALIAEGSARAETQGASFDVSPVTAQLLDPWLRLLQLLDSPEDIPVLAPLLEREILYRLLRGPQGSTLRQIALADSRLSQVRRAIAWIRTNYDSPLRVDALAELAGMSTASFHRHFKAATAMSPLQYQKCLRLQEARRLLIANQDAARAAFAVGYESASQFSREYSRLFGASPARDAIRLRGEEAGSDEHLGT